MTPSDADFYREVARIDGAAGAAAEDVRAALIGAGFEVHEEEPVRTWPTCSTASTQVATLRGTLAVWPRPTGRR